MKMIKTIICAVLAAQFMTLGVNAQTAVTAVGGGNSDAAAVIVPDGNPVPPPSLPMTTALLKAYAFTRVDHISGGLWAASLSGPNYFNVEYNGGPDENAMAALARSQELNVTVDPRDSIQVSLSYRGWIELEGGGGYDYQLFNGYKDVNLVPGRGGYELPENAYNIELELSDWIPFPVPGAQYVSMEVENAEGRREYYSFSDQGRFNRQEGFIFLGREILDQNGRVFIRYPNNVVATYDLPTGRQVSVETIHYTGLEPRIDGVRTVKLSPNVVNQIVCSAEDEVILVKPDTNNGRYYFRITFDPAIPAAQRPIGIYGISVNEFTNDPHATWGEVGMAPASPFILDAPHRIFLRFERAPHYTPLPQGGGGRG